MHLGKQSSGTGKKFREWVIKKVNRAGLAEAVAGGATDHLGAVLRNIFYGSAAVTWSLRQRRELEGGTALTVQLTGFQYFNAKFSPAPVPGFRAQPA